MINLKIDPEFQNQIPPLTDDEYKQLEENILAGIKICKQLRRNKIDAGCIFP